MVFIDRIVKVKPQIYAMCTNVIGANAVFQSTVNHAKLSQCNIFTKVAAVSAAPLTKML